MRIIFARRVVSGTPGWAKVLWEDVPGLILADENGYLPALIQGTGSSVIGGIDPQNSYSTYQLVFQVPNTLSRLSGNAVIGVYDTQGVLMWSWHIWVTDYVAGQGDVTLNGVRFSVPAVYRSGGPGQPGGSPGGRYRYDGRL